MTESKFRVMSDEEFQAWWAKAKQFNLKRWLRWKRQNLGLWVWYILHPRFATTNSMGEISGFGGSYELACRAMLKSGLYWLEANPNLEPHYRGFENVYGIMQGDNEDAKAMDDAMMKPVKGHGVSGAMHQAVASRLLWIKVHTWEEYVEKQLEYELAD